MESREVCIEMRDLYRRYRGGDVLAGQELESRFAPLIQRIVRRIVRSRSVSSGLDERVLSEAGRLLERESMGVFSSEHARVLANRILRTVFARSTESRLTSHRMETVRHGHLACPTATYPL